MWTSINHTGTHNSLFQKSSGDVVLNTMLNYQQMKHVLIGNKVWNILKSDYQIKLLIKTKRFKGQEKMDGLVLLFQVKKKVISSTSVGSTNLKNELENTQQNKFGHNIKKYNICYSNIKRSVKKVEGAYKYNAH